MSSTRSSTLRTTTHSFCQALTSPTPPSELLGAYFSGLPKITEHGPEWARSRLPFLAKTFTGAQECEEYFSLMSGLLEMSLGHDAFPEKEGFVVDAEAFVQSAHDTKQGQGGIVTVMGKAHFKSKETGKTWNEQFVFKFSEFDEQGRIGHWEIWGDTLSAWEAVSTEEIRT